MNMLPILALAAFTVALFVGLVWAISERGRERARADELAARLQETTAQLTEASARARLLEGQSEQMAEFLKAQAAQSANLVAEELLKRNAETMRSQDQITQARLEAQLKPVAETLAKFESQV